MNILRHPTDPKPFFRVEGEARRKIAAALRAEVEAAYHGHEGTNQHQQTPRRSNMHEAGASMTKIPEKAPVPDRTPEIEAMCCRLAELRAHATRIEELARNVEVKILGPIPEEAAPSIAVSTAAPGLVGIMGSDLGIAQNSLCEVTRSLDRIMQELGSIGQE